MTNKTIAASLVSKRDRDKVATIKRMLSEHHARSVVECVAIGEQIHHHLERKALNRGDVQRYAKAFAATGWKNLYTHEPQRSK